MIYLYVRLTRMTIFIKTKFKISDDQTTIDKYRLAANITVYHIISKLILQRIIIANFCGVVSHLRWSTISDLQSPSNFQVKEFFLFKSEHKQGNWTFVVLTVIWESTISLFTTYLTAIEIIPESLNSTGQF